MDYLQPTAINWNSKGTPLLKTLREKSERKISNLWFFSSRKVWVGQWQTKYNIDNTTADLQTPQISIGIELMAFGLALKRFSLPSQLASATAPLIVTDLFLWMCLANLRMRMLRCNLGRRDCDAGDTKGLTPMRTPASFTARDWWRMLLFRFDSELPYWTNYQLCWTNYRLESAGVWLRSAGQLVGRPELSPLKMAFGKCANRAFAPLRLAWGLDWSEKKEIVRIQGNWSENVSTHFKNGGIARFLGDVGTKFAALLS